MGYSAFQSNAFQSNAFQIIGSGSSPNPNDVILLGGTPAGPNVNPNAPGFMYDTPWEAYKREQAVVAEKQEAVIALKLEAQENLLRQKELQKHKDKQTARQLKALEREQAQLTVAIQEAMTELEQRQRIARNNMAILTLLMACPYLNIVPGGSAMN